MLNYKLCYAAPFQGAKAKPGPEGLDPLLDCDRESWNMDPGLLEEELERCEKEGKLPKAVVPTDLYGQCCDLPRILEVCDQYDVPVVCDSAEAMGAKYHPQIPQITRINGRKKAQNTQNGRWEGDFSRKGAKAQRMTENDPQITQIYSDSKGKKQYPCRVVGGEVAPQLNTLKGPGSTGQGGLCYNNNRGYPARAIGGKVAEDLFERGLCLPSGTAMTDRDLDRVVETILNSRPSEIGSPKLHGAGKKAQNTQNNY